MKTINNTQETGNRNIKNFNMKTFAVLTSVAMFSFIFSANASNSMSAGAESDNFPSVAAIHLAHPSSEAAGSAELFMEVATENNLDVENWMTNESLFAPLAVPEFEEPMGVEEWMINSENFMETIFLEENDQLLEVEGWMLDNENFSTFTINEESDQALDVEGWMLDQNFWGK